MSTSLKVVNIAVSFFTATKRFATVLRSDVIFSARSLRDLVSLVVIFKSAARASDLVIRPATPVPLTSLGSTPFSASIFAAAGLGVPVA